jgi:hypothetical protein
MAAQLVLRDAMPGDSNREALRAASCQYRGDA